MSRRVLYLSLLSLSLTACSSGNNKQALGDFDYANTKELAPLITPEGLSKPKKYDDFVITKKINEKGPIGKAIDIRAPSLVMPIAASSRVVTESDVSIIWFDKVLEEQDLLTFIEKVVKDKLTEDNINYTVITEDVETTLSKVFEGSTSLKETSIDREGIRTSIVDSDWFHNEVDTGWIFTEIEKSTSLRFRYQLLAKPHGRSVSLRVSLIDYLQTDETGVSKPMDPIDQQRAEKTMLNNMISLVDYSYRLQKRENRLMRANQKLVTIGKNSKAEEAYVVEMGIDNLWDNMPIFFEKHGFTISDINEGKRIYYVDFVKPDTSIWDSIWGEDVPVIDVSDDNYQFVLAPLDEKDEKTSVTIYKADGEPLSMEALERIFPVIEAGLSFRNVF
jgi:outer membrane protein assembly factor BamC